MTEEQVEIILILKYGSIGNAITEWDKTNADTWPGTKEEYDFIFRYIWYRRRGFYNPRNPMK